MEGLPLLLVAAIAAVLIVAILAWARRSRS